MGIFTSGILESNVLTTMDEESIQNIENIYPGESRFILL